MNDRELLELAAKAAGIECEIEGFSGGRCFGTNQHNEIVFDPLTDDGDALRLAVNLGMNVVVKILPHAIYVEAYNGQSPSVMETLADVRGKDFDPYASTRRAITRAAAEVGRNMK